MAKIKKLRFEILEEILSMNLKEEKKNWELQKIKFIQLMRQYKKLLMNLLKNSMKLLPAKKKI